MDERARLIAQLLAIELERLAPLARKAGYGLAVNRSQRSIDTLTASEVTDADLAGLERFFSLYSSSLAGSFRAYLFAQRASEIVDGLDVGAEIKLGLKLAFRVIQVEHVAGEHGFAIEGKRILEKIPLVAELPPDTQLELVSQLQKAYHGSLTGRFGERVERQLLLVAEQLRAGEIKAANMLLASFALELNVEANHIVSF